MAILWMEGWDSFGDDAYLAYKYWGQSLTGGSFQTGRSGNGFCWRNSTTSTTLNFQVPGGATVPNIVLGFGFRKVSNLASDDIVRFYAEDGVNEQLTMRITPVGELAIDRGTTQIGITSGLGLITNIWYYLELDITFGDGTAGSVELFVNGNSELNLTSQDTRNVTGENCGRLWFGGDTSAPHDFDDMYLLDDQGTDQTTRIGPCFIETVFPDANGTTNDFTASPAVSNYLNVDDTTPDQDTTYNHSSTATHKELYGHGALTESIGTIYAVEARALVRTDSAGARGVQNVARSNVTEVNGTEHFIDQSYFYVDHIYENDPNGGGAWTESSVNAAEFGIRIST